MQAFQSFKLAVDSRRKFLNALRSVGIQLQTEEAASVLAAWAEQVQLRHSQMRTSERYYCTTLLSHTFTGWAECVAVDLLDREQKLSQFCASRHSARSKELTRATFMAWRQTTANGGTTEYQHQILQQCVNRMQRRSTRAILAEWRLVVDARYERMSQLLFLRSKLLKASALRCW